MKILSQVVTTIIILLFIACLVSCVEEQKVEVPKQHNLYIHGADGEITVTIPQPDAIEDTHIYVSEE